MKKLCSDNTAYFPQTSPPYSVDPTSPGHRGSEGHHSSLQDCPIEMIPGDGEQTRRATKTIRIIHWQGFRERITERIRAIPIFNGPADIDNAAETLERPRVQARRSVD